MNFIMMDSTEYYTVWRYLGIDNNVVITQCGNGLLVHMVWLVVVVCSHALRGQAQGSVILVVFLISHLGGEWSGRI